MKKYVMIAFIAFLTVSCTLSAQDNNRRRGQEGNREQREAVERVTPQERVVPQQARTNAQERAAATPQQRAEELARQLELTAEQRAQIQALFERQSTQLRQQQGQRGDQESRRQATAEFDAELERIIGSERMEEWRRIRVERGGGGRGR